MLWFEEEAAHSSVIDHISGLVKDYHYFSCSQVTTNQEGRAYTPAEVSRLRLSISCLFPMSHFLCVYATAQNV